MQLSQTGERKPGSDVEQNRVRFDRVSGCIFASIFACIDAGRGAERQREFSRLAAAHHIEIVLAEHVFKTNEQHGLVA